MWIDWVQLTVTGTVVSFVQFQINQLLQWEILRVRLLLLPDQYDKYIEMHVDLQLMTTS